MSGSAYNAALNSTTCFTPVRQGVIEYIDNGIDYTSTDEYAGKVGAVLGVVASIFIPFAAPAVWGAIATSTGIAGGLAAAGASGFVTGLASVAGSALTGALMNAGVAAATGGDVGRAALMGALGGAGGALTRGLGAGANAAQAGGQVAAGGIPASTVNAVGAGQAGMLSGTAHAGIQAGAASVGVGGASAANSLVAGAGGMAASSTLQSGIRSMFGNVNSTQMRQISAQLINAAVNGQDMGEMNALVEQQRAELAQLDAAAKAGLYAQAQQVIAAADRSDPAMARLWAVADVAGTEARQHRQAMRDIATRQGGSLDAGQQKAYERGKSLHTARSKALAGNQAYRSAELTQNQLRATGAQLLGQAENAAFQRVQYGNEVEAAGMRANRESRHDLWGGVMAGLTEGWDYNPTTSPNPTTPQQEDDDEGFGSFGWGRGG